MRSWGSGMTWVALLGLALILRLWMISQGGAYFWPDEVRSDRAIFFWEQLVQADIRGMAQSFFMYPEHTLFRILLQPVAWSLREMPLLGQVWLSVLGMGQILVVARIARQWGASPLEAWWAGLLMVLSSTTLYYSRHLLPYDSALLIGLLGVWVGTKPQYRFWHSIATSVLGLAVFFTYNGHWPLTALVFAFHLLPVYHRHSLALLRRIQGLLIGVLIWTLFWALLSIVSGLPLRSYLTSLASFSGTVTQGVFSEGYSFPFQFLWDAERFLAVLWLLGCLDGLWVLWKKATDRQVLLALAAVFMLYAMLTLFSTILERFVVYGRLVKMMVPFLCILGAFSLHRLWQADKRLVYGVLALLIINSFFTIGPVLRVMFAVDFRREMEAQYGTLDEAPTFSAADEPFVPSTRYVLYGTDYNYYEYDGLTPPPAGLVLVRRENAQDFLPYAYEGLVPYQRQLIAENDIPLLLIDTQTE